MGLLQPLADDLPAHEHAHDAGHHQSPGPAGGIAQTVQIADVGVEVLVHLHPVAVKFKLRRIEQSLIRGEAGCNVIHRLDKIEGDGYESDLWSAGKHLNERFFISLVALEVLGEKLEKEKERQDSTKECEDLEDLE